jgi:hypothetical protein
MKRLSALVVEQPTSQTSRGFARNVVKTKGASLGRHRTGGGSSRNPVTFRQYVLANYWKSKRAAGRVARIWLWYEATNTRTLNYPATSPWSGKHQDGCVTRLPGACVVCSHGPRKHTAEAYPGAGQSFDTAGLSLIPNTGKADSLPAHTCLRRIGMLIIVPNTIEIARSGPKSEGFGFVSNTRELVWSPS